MEYSSNKKSRHLDKKTLWIKFLLLHLLSLLLNLFSSSILHLYLIIFSIRIILIINIINRYILNKRNINFMSSLIFTLLNNSINISNSINRRSIIKICHQLISRPRPYLKYHHNLNNQTIQSNKTKVFHKNNNCNNIQKFQHLKQHKLQICFVQ